MSDKPKSTFVPNSFQTPNGYVDDVMPYLTGEEYKVLIYATRRILGFQKRQDRISLSQFTDGTKSIKDGHTLDSGTGLCKETVRNCLANLVTFGLMVKDDDNTKSNEGTLWSLQWDENEVNWQALQKRLEKKSRSDADRIAKARSMRQTAVCGTGHTPSSGTDGGGSSGTDTQNTGLETQLKTSNKDTFLEIISSAAFSIFIDIQAWFNVRKILERDAVGITGDADRKPDLDDPMKIVISGLSEKPKGGQFTLAQIWEERFTQSFLRQGIAVTFEA